MGLHFGFWDDSVLNLAEAIVKQNELMAKFAGINALHKVLDAGCGVGGSVIYLAKNIGCHSTGITLAPNQIKSANEYAAKENVLDKVDFKEMDFTKTTFENNSFDIVWAIESVCHADDKNEFLKEAFRLLKKGGKLIVADYFPAKENFTKAEYKQVYTNGLNGWAVNEMCNDKEFAVTCTHLGFANSSIIDADKYVTKSVEKLIQKNRRWLIPGWIYYKLGGITDTEFMNAYGAYNFCKSFGKLWHYKIFIAEK
jgi:cyclopropane fatty-acyl-phospholipid synthase-like methyltransferase